MASVCGERRFVEKRPCKCFPKDIRPYFSWERCRQHWLQIDLDLPCSPRKQLFLLPYQPHTHSKKKIASSGSQCTSPLWRPVSEHHQLKFRNERIWSLLWRSEEDKEQAQRVERKWDIVQVGVLWRVTAFLWKMAQGCRLRQLLIQLQFHTTNQPGTKEGKMSRKMVH